ncbi:MAG: T9SS type A sorting domain-containing protein, partial [Ignavibacteriaceae bacterium]
EKSRSNESFYVFNPLSWERNDFADYQYSGTDSIHVVDLNTNKEVPFQIVNIGTKNFLRIFAKNIPPIGYKVFDIEPGKREIFGNAATISDNSIENDKYKIIISDRGAILSLIDKTQDNKEYVQEINGRSLNDLGTGSGNISIENSGPVSVTLKINSNAPLSHISRITLFKDIDRIEIKNEITQNFSNVYTWGFGFNISNPEIWHEEVGAVIKAKLLDQGGQYSPINARYDWLTLNHFVDINNGILGVTLSNADCYFMKIGNSDENNLDINTPMISILAGGQVDGDGLGIPNQGGDNYFLQRFALQTHLEYNAVSAMKFAMEHQNPLLASQVLGGNDYPGNIYSLTSINNPDIIAWALKPSEDGIENGIIVRLWNLSDNDQNFDLSLNSKVIQNAKITTSIETPIEDANFKGNTLNGTINSKQIKTYLINSIESTVGLRNDEINTRRSSKDYILYQNYPNPFNSIAKIQFIIPEKNKVVIKIYNVLGEEIKQIFNQVADNGFHEIQFNAGELPSGIYFYKMETEKFSDVKKLILLK